MSKRLNKGLNQAVRTIVFPLLLLCSFTTSLSAQVSQQPDPALQSYLRSRNLTELLILQLQATVQNGGPSEKQAAASELLGIYVSQMQQNTEQYDRWSVQIDELARQFPEAIPLSSQVSIAFSRYQNAKTIFEEWVWNRNDPTLQREANSRFASVIQRATDAIAQISEQLQEQQPPQDEAVTNSSSNPTSAGDPDRDSGDPRLDELRTALSQFQYLTAWARYYRGITLSDDQQRIVLLNAAEAQFLELLGVADLQQFQTLTPKWFSLNSEWTCRIVLGIGMVQRALSRHETADFCFNLLGDPQVPAAIAANQRVWSFNSMVFPGDLERAATWADIWADNQNAKYDIAFWSSVATTGLSWNDPAAEQLANRLAAVGLIRLIKANEFALVDELIIRYPEINISGDQFFAQWTNGYVHLKKYESRDRLSTSSETLQSSLPRALQFLRDALQDNRSSVDSVYRARCRYHFGFALYLDQQFAAASEQFRQASAVLDAVDPRLAEHAYWMRCQTLETLSTNELSWRNQFDFALNDFQKRYPRSSHASKVAFMQIMNQVASDDLSTAAVTLDNVPEDDPNFQRARFELCRLLHQTWVRSSTDGSDKTGDEGDRQAAAENFLETAEDYLNRFPLAQQPNSLESQRAAQICLLAADVSRSQKRSSQSAQRWLDRSRTMLPTIDSYPGIGSDYYFMVLQLASEKQEWGTKSMAADWLLSNTSKPQHFKLALIAKAESLDRQIQPKLADGTFTEEQLHKTIDAYRRLLEEYKLVDGGTVSDIVSTARLRMGTLLLEAKMFAEAKELFASLLQVGPNEFAYLAGMAKCEYELNEFSLAATRFQTLAANSAAGTDKWLNAKYYLIKCLQQTDVSKARKILQQTNLLAPSLTNPWQKLFQELAEQLEPRCP